MSYANNKQDAEIVFDRSIDLCVIISQSLLFEVEFVCG
jgi:hypothetical protein